jgi:GNAT superfamily N-acetyltransferase
MPAPLLIRAATSDDAASLSLLVGQLGYPASSEEMPRRLDALKAAGDAVVLVAEVDGAVVGLLTCHVFATIHSTAPAALLTALVVSEQARGGGVGRRLVARAEEWARAMGAVRIAVTSGAQRAEAHAFYERIGYARTGVRFGKKL